MFRRLLKKIRSREAGVTGLETAIILIAFVIVASVFAYVVLSAGLFSSQKAKEAVNAGLDSTMATIEIKGDIIARMENSVLKEIIFGVAIPSAGSPVDFAPATENVTSVIISYQDQDHFLASVNWTLERLSTINDDYLLDPNEVFAVTVTMPSDNITIGPYDNFALEIKPPNGPVLPIQRTVPGRVSQYVNLH
jgi:archaeal flagellin FlaB